MTGNEATVMPGRDEKLRKAFGVPDAGRRETLAVQRRREGRHDEAVQQQLLVETLLGQQGQQGLLNPAFAFFTDWRTGRGQLWPVCGKKIGQRAGLPDLMFVVYWKPAVFIEMKKQAWRAEPGAEAGIRRLKLKGDGSGLRGAERGRRARGSPPVQRPVPPAMAAAAAARGLGMPIYHDRPERASAAGAGGRGTAEGGTATMASAAAGLQGSEVGRA